LGFRARSIILLGIDIILVNLALYVTLLMRFEALVPAEYLRAFFRLIPFITIITILFLMSFKLYSRIWEYASINEMLAILRATTYSMITIALLIYLLKLPILPLSVYIISWMVMNFLIGFSRLSWRLLHDLFLKTCPKLACKMLIVGAGDAGAILVREIESNPHLLMKVVGLVDDDPSKRGKILHGVKILGNHDQIPSLISQTGAEEIIIAMPSVSGNTIRGIINICKQTSARIKILPGIYQSTDKSLLADIRDLQMEDLLRREPVNTDLNTMASYICDRVILITGAGGSIGSELCRQVIKLSPRRLVMLDSCENNLFEIEMELAAMDKQNIICPRLVDVRNKRRLESIFRKYKPQVVFHAAAFKHVPMMERHPEEAIENNVIGTRYTAELADKYGAETFIQVSTDKAVNPTSVMGASKRIAELVIKDINRHSKTRFAAVRFGNVLGSRGSVIPTFMKQIENGGPVTVTHPEMRRYFMTIPEAVQLIIQAGAIAEGGEIFVLDMGEMVKIDDLARDLIRLSGFKPDRDIKIVYTGIRPGEKLYEELFTDRESLLATRYQRIFISSKEMDEVYNNIDRTIMTFANNENWGKRDVIEFIIKLLPEYQPRERSAVG